MCSSLLAHTLPAWRKTDFPKLNLTSKKKLRGRDKCNLSQKRMDLLAPLNVVYYTGHGIKHSQSHKIKLVQVKIVKEGLKSRGEYL